MLIIRSIQVVQYPPIGNDPNEDPRPSPVVEEEEARREKPAPKETSKPVDRKHVVIPQYPKEGRSSSRYVPPILPTMSRPPQEAFSCFGNPWG